MSKASAPRHDLLLSIYDAVAQDSLWPDVLQRVAEEIGAVGCIVFEWLGPPSTRHLTAPLLSAGYVPAEVGKYLEKCKEFEARDQGIFEARSLRSDGIDLIEDDVLAASDAALADLPNVRILRKLGIFHRAAGLLNKDNTATSRFSIQLADGRGRLSPEERATLSGLLPHIAKALDLGRPARQLAAQQQAMLAAMDRLLVGVAFLDGAGRVVAANREFRRQEEECGVFQTARSGVLSLKSPEHEKRFQTLKADIANHGQFGARPRKEAISTSQDAFLCIEVAPLGTVAELGSAALDGFVVYSCDTSRPIQCDTEAMQTAYGLTRGEASVVSAIAQGLTNVQIAEQRDRSVATINTQVKSLLAKTGCANRTQFVRLVMSFGANYVGQK